MKKLFITLTALAAVLASCSKEAEQQAPETEDVKGPVTLNVILPETKTALGEKQGNLWPNYWSEGDKISVNGVTSEPLDAAGAGKATASFTVDGIAAPFYAAYPAASLSAYNAGNATITIPAAQSYVAGSYDPAAYVMLASGSETTLTFSSKVAIFKLTPTGEKSIKKIVLSSIGSDKIAGAFSTDFSTITPAAGALTSLAVTADSPVSAGTPWFIVVPAVDYSVNGLRVRIEDAEGGSMTCSATPDKAWAAGKMYSEVIPYAPVASDFTISAEGITSSTAVICLPDASYAAAALTFNVYSDADCSNLLESYSVPADAACWAGAAPRFCISGLAPGVTYFVKVSNDTAHSESNSLSVTTAAFNIVEVSSNPAAVGDVILAEDFGELRWDCDMIGNGAGWFPTSEAQASFTTLGIGSFQAAATSNEKQISAQGTAVAASRLAHWAQGANPHMYVHPGYIKLVGQNKVTHIVTPALDNIPDGKLATLEVEVTASAYYSETSHSFATTSAIVAVQPAGAFNELGDDPNTNTLLDLATNIAPITLDAATAWKTYKVTLTGVGKGARLAFGAAGSVTGNNARMNISDMKVTVKALDDPAPVGITASVNAVSSSTAVFTWTYGGSADDDIAKPYTIALYRNSALTDLVVSFDIPADNGCWYGKTPSFVFGGLNPSTEYWFVVTDTEANISSDPVSATTEAFTPVDATTISNAAVGDVILAEDFSEIGAGPDEITESAGFVPSSKVLPVVPSGLSPSGSFEPYRTSSGPYGDRIIGAGWDLGSSRLSNDWGFFGGSSCYYGAGYLRLATSSGRSHIVTPALSGIPAGKLATIEVTVTACKYETSTNDIAVFVEKGLTMNGTDDLSSSSYKKYTGASLSDGHGLGITAAKSWVTKSVTINKVESDHQLLIGSLENAKNRCYISDVVVSIVSLKDKGAIDTEVNIQDFDTFKAFLEACEPGKTVKGNVLADITLTSEQVAEIDALYPVAEFDGILNGNNHSIAGLTKPLFEAFSGSVSDLTLNSTLSITDAMNNIGILAGRVSNATISGCITNGSVAVNCASEVNGDLSIAGMVGLNDGGTMTNCVNNASVTNNSSSNGEIRIGGLVGLSHASLESCYNTGALTNNGSTYDDEINIAGVVGVCYGNLTACSNGTNSLAGGTISNTATSGTDTIQDMQIGGIIGNNKGGNTITSCFNTGNVINSGAGAKISIGGLAGWSSASTTYTSTCYNTGNLTNNGTGSSNPGLCMGGLLGVARGANTLTGTASVYNYNKSVLVDDSETLDVAVGGICGYSDNAASNFDYTKSLIPDGADVEDIEIKNNTKNTVYVGGILGRSAVSSTLDYTFNNSDIKFTNLKITETGQVFGGGIIGGWTASGEQTITGCVNEGWVYTKASAGDLAAADSDALPKYWSCFAGIAGMGAGTSQSLGGGWNTITGKTFINCTNTGTVRIYAALRCCIAGVVAYTENNPDGCVSTADDIRPYLTGGIGKVGDNYHRNICGGVVGLCTASKVSNLKSTAKIVSQSSSPFAYTGGIIGYVPAGAIELENCKVSNHVQATGSGDGRSALMCHVAQNAVTVTFTNCAVKKGTLSYATGSKVSISSSNISAQHCVGSGSKYTIVNDVLPTVVDSID